MIRAGSALAGVWQLTMAQVRDRIVGSGLLTEEEVDEWIAVHDDEAFVVMHGIEMKAWGASPVDLLAPERVIAYFS